MKTAMQELIEIISHEQDHKKAGSEEWFALSNLKVEAEKLLEKEKQQIVDAYLKSVQHECDGLDNIETASIKEDAEDYYTERYK